MSWTRSAAIAFYAAFFFALCFTAHASLEIALPQQDGPILLYSTEINDDVRESLIAAINAAKHSVVCAFYNLSDQKIIHALRTKAEKGAHVFVVVDRKASSHAHRDLGRAVQTLRRSPSGLMHLKIMVIDEEEVWLGSANVSYLSLRFHKNLMVSMVNPPLAAPLANYIQKLPLTGTASNSGPLFFRHKGQDGELWLLPCGERGLTHLVELIRQAKISLRVAMFTWTHPALTQAVIDAHQSGVEVTIAIDHRQGRGVGAEVVHNLQRAGVPVYLNLGEELLHHKMAIIDGQTLILGSANWTRSAFKQNDDCYLVLNPVTDQQRTCLDRLWERLLFTTDWIKSNR